MVDIAKPARLRGFHVSVVDVGEQMHFCHPLLSFGDDPGLYFAHDLDWRNDPDSLVFADPEEAATLGTLLPRTIDQPMSSGEGVVAVGTQFFDIAEAATIEIQGPEIPLIHIGDLGCWLGIATAKVYRAFRTALARDASAAFDRALGEAACSQRKLSAVGNAALLLMRRCGAGRREDLAIRQLAGEWKNGSLDVYRRLLIRFSVELNTQEGLLDERAKRHIQHTAFAAQTWGATVQPYSPQTARIGYRDAPPPSPATMLEGKWHVIAIKPKVERSGWVGGRRRQQKRIKSTSGFSMVVNTAQRRGQIGNRAVRMVEKDTHDVSQDERVFA